MTAWSVTLDSLGRVTKFEINGLSPTNLDERDIAGIEVAGAPGTNPSLIFYLAENVTIEGDSDIKVVEATPATAGLLAFLATIDPAVLEHRALETMPPVNSGDHQTGRGFLAAIRQLAEEAT